MYFRFRLFLLIGIPLISITSPAQQKEGSNTYLIVRIASNDMKREFSFKGTYVFKSGKKSFYQVIDTKAPYELKTNSGVGFLVLRGESGDGKVTLKYKVSSEEKESFQYLDAGEVMVIEFTPLGKGAPSNIWQSKRSTLGFAGIEHELKVWTFTNK
jgi:hypothetical protein